MIGQSTGIRETRRRDGQSAFTAPADPAQRSEAATMRTLSFEIASQNSKLKTQIAHGKKTPPPNPLLHDHKRRSSRFPTPVVGGVLMSPLPSVAIAMWRFVP